jgi:hypothetical protein
VVCWCDRYGLGLDSTLVRSTPFSSSKRLAFVGECGGSATPSETLDTKTRPHGPTQEIIRSTSRRRVGFRRHTANQLVSRLVAALVGEVLR